MLALQEEAGGRDSSGPATSSTADRQSDPDSVGSKAWWAALKEDIARCRENGERHSRRICDVLDGLHGRNWQKWLERQLENSPRDADSVPKRTAETRKLCCITCGHSFTPDVVDKRSWVKCPECGFNTPRDALCAK
jgi:hypothetical protein